MTPPLFICHNNSGGFVCTDECDEDEHIPVAVALPLFGMPERRHLYKWMALEDGYVFEKYGHLRDEQDEKMSTDFDWWIDYVFRYLSAAKTYWTAAVDQNLDEVTRRQFAIRAEQQMAKAAMTAKDLAASAIRVFGNLPKPGLSSGNIEEWEG